MRLTVKTSPTQTSAALYMILLAEDQLMASGMFVHLPDL